MRKFILVLILLICWISSIVCDPFSIFQAGSEFVTIKIKKTTAGAAVAGGLLGTISLGPIGGIIAAGGAAFASVKDGAIGDKARDIGRATFNFLEESKKILSRSIHKP